MSEDQFGTHQLNERVIHLLLRHRRYGAYQLM